MPEGDTVWLTAHRLDQALAGRSITLSDFRVPQLATLDLVDDGVREVVARGKHILARLDSERTLHSHLRMDGSWHLTRAGVMPTRFARHEIRVLLGNDEWLATGYRMHDLALVPTSAEDDLVGHLGPDLLGADWNLDAAVARLMREPDRAVGETLLEQRHLAGIGNMYKCEVLFVERVDPWTPTAAVDELPHTDLRRVVATAHRLLRANRDHPAQSTTGRTGRGQEHWVYGRGGQPCLRCRTRIRREDQGRQPEQRSTYWCPRCQPAVSTHRIGDAE